MTVFPAPPAVTHLTPILNVSDIRASIAWFMKWGWNECWTWSESGAGEPTFAAVGSGACEIFMCKDGQGGRGAAPEGADHEATSRGVWMSVWVRGVDAMHEACARAGLRVLVPPEDKPWRVREFHLQHPDGHVFRVSQGITR
ncbi:MAG TPA: bleomycin resistance family protein [Phycisphaerales bacterium]|nr:bleomycin resistance family protein [Phycisphaerales bacterium]